MVVADGIGSDRRIAGEGLMEICYGRTRSGPDPRESSKGQITFRAERYSNLASRRAPRLDTTGRGFAVARMRLGRPDTMRYHER
jgi:hypothetical protein